ncbi:hypothetical protein JVT61DRAFT_15493 [Boletus reticuloceps]|uniref:Uncharacterized protein n=1 Tax=Boletus reticuloceps TaxID=495285 RepID=A0A8I2YCC1_9AGAM|nr:hypothetical protein JVT61DRAFT_15493 [Boletus reticuloceps]
MSTDSGAGKLATPRRTTPMQALSGLFRTPTRFRTPTAVSHRNKRTRARTSSLSSSSSPSTPSLPAVVLQTYSVSTDSIVLTALPSVPFCCHEDLLTMTRAQLEAVVRALNARLPRRMRIGPEDDFWNDTGEYDDDDDDGVSRMSEAELKRRVEEMVGIRPVVGKNRVSRLGLGLGARTGVPPAPKAVRTRNAAWKPYQKTPWEMEMDAGGDMSDDSSIMIEDALLASSPLASRTNFSLHVRSRNNNTLPRLAILREENEGGESKEDDSEDNEPPPSKRQRVSSASVTRHSEGGSQIVQEVRKSRLIENMDLSGSPLLARDDDASSRNFAEHDERATTTTINSNSAMKTPEEGVQAPAQRRRSTRIKEIALKRAPSVDTGNKVAANARNSKSTFLRSRTSLRRSSSNVSTSLEGADPGKDSATPRELTIRLPFTSTPPHQKTDSSIWFAPRILRSHSQHLQSSSLPMKTKSSLGRSQSERYPRPSDLAFVTINRPRYNFTRRKSKDTKGDQALHPSMSISPAHDARQSLQGIQTDTEHEHEKENNDNPKVVTRSSPVGNLYAVPFALCSILAPRSRAPSTSTITSTRGNGGDSPARMTLKEGIAPTEITGSVANDGAAERVWEALGRMVVDSL